jgi:hypothetical protein
MPATLVPPQPQQNSPVLAPQENIWSALWRNYWVSLDQMLRSAQLGPLPQAANDAAAAAVGVPINGLYRSGSQVMIRVT